MEILRNNLTQVNVLANQKRENAPFMNLGSNKSLATDVFEKQHSNAKNVSFGGMKSMGNEPVKATLNDVKNAAKELASSANKRLPGEFQSTKEQALAGLGIFFTTLPRPWENEKNPESVVNKETQTGIANTEQAENAAQPAPKPLTKIPEDLSRPKVGAETSAADSINTVKSLLNVIKKGSDSVQSFVEQSNGTVMRNYLKSFDILFDTTGYSPLQIISPEGGITLKTNATNHMSEVVYNTKTGTGAYIRIYWSDDAKAWIEESGKIHKNGDMITNNKISRSCGEDGTWSTIETLKNCYTGEMISQTKTVKAHDGTVISNETVPAKSQNTTKTAKSAVQSAAKPLEGIPKDLSRPKVDAETSAADSLMTIQSFVDVIKKGPASIQSFVKESNGTTRIGYRQQWHRNYVQYGELDITTLICPDEGFSLSTNTCNHSVYVIYNPQTGRGAYTRTYWSDKDKTWIEASGSIKNGIIAPSVEKISHSLTKDGNRVSVKTEKNPTDNKVIYKSTIVKNSDGKIISKQDKGDIRSVFFTMVDYYQVPE